MKKIILTLAFILSFAIYTNAQDYNTGIGLRGGFNNGLTIKHFIGDQTALEGILATRWKGINVALLLEMHNPAFDTDGLNWYYGFGGHVGFWNGNDVSWADDNDSYVVVGVDGILGIEYNFPDFPINISLDWKPAFNIVGYSGFWGDGGALSIRYIF